MIIKLCYFLINNMEKKYLSNPKKFYVYKTVNDIDESYYIGSHYGKINDSYYGSGTNIKKLINEYGKQHFKKEILHICDSREQMIICEQKEINNNIDDKNCLNKTIRTFNCHQNEKSKKAIGEASKSHWKNTEYRHKILSYLNNQSEKTKKRISETIKQTLRNKKSLGISLDLSEETKRKISKTVKDKNLDPDYHDKLILARRKCIKPKHRIGKTNKSEDFDVLWRKRLSISQKFLKITKLNNMKFFSLNELIHSATARRLKIINEPPEHLINNGVRLINEVLDPIREKWGAPIHVNSGYRCPELNKAVGGVRNSNHMKFTAADITVGTTADNKKLYNMILSMKQTLPINELILEKGGIWIHISVKI